MRKWLALLAGALFAGAALAADITEAQARTVAAYFVEKDTIGMRTLPNRTVDTVTKRGGLWLVTLKPSGHIFVSVNRSAEPIPSFSENDFTEPEAGSPQAAFLALAETNSINATGTKYETRWKTLLGQKVLRLTTSSTTEYVNIDPLVKSTWTQNYPYNDLMPIVNSKSTLVGCVATAYSQILRFWEWPEVLDEDFITEHTVDSTWGHKWRLKAGTIFDWETMPLSDGYDYASRLKLGRGAMFAGMLARMKYNTEASGAQTERPGQNRWYTAPRVFDTANSELTEREAAMKQSLLNGCPFMVSVNYGTTGHAVVGDGWQESASGKYVHMNYGWGSADNTYYTTSSALGVYLDAKPRPMVMNKPLAASSTLPVKIEWSFPKYGYTNNHTGFDVSYTEVEDTITDWTDGMDSQTGEIDGNLITLETVDSSGHGPVLRIGTQADEATYTWPTMVATKDTVFSYDIHSKEALNMLVEMQVLDPSVGWIALATPEISAKSEIEWTNHSFNLGHYAGKGIAIRVKASRTGSTYTKDETARLLGVQFDNITLTKVRQPKAAVAGRETAGKDARYLDVSGSLASGKTYLFQVTPTFNDGTEGIPGYKASCKIVDTAVEKPSITSVTSVRSGAPTVQNNMYRECYFGLNQFGVYGSEATTKLEAYLSNLVVVDQGVPFWDTVVNGWATGKGLRSLDGVVSVDTKSNGKFLVKVDASQLTSYLNGVGMILTLIARNDQGDAAQKDFYLEFTKTGTEQELAVADLPENGGTVTPDEPDPVYYYVYFDSMGGNTIASRYLKEGDKLGTLTEPTKDGYTFAGWFTASTGGTQITANTTVSKTITYYAQWNKVEDSDPDPEEDPDEPSGGDDPVIDPTDGNANDFTEGGVNYRFCNGVDKTNGFSDVHRSGSYNTLPPISYNLIYWWTARYNAAFGNNPSDYSAPSESNMATSDSGLTIAGYTETLLNSALPETLPAGAEREKYFPAGNTAAATWCGDASDKAVQVGRHIYAALAKGPIGFKAHTSSQKFYCGVIWGCEYSADDTGKYATKLWVTDTRKNDDGVRVLAFGNYSNSYGSLPGLKDFNGSGTYGLIEYYYPIVGPATASGGEDEPDDPVVTPTMFTVTFDANGGTSSTSTLEVEEGKTIAELPTAELANYTFDGWFDSNGNELTTSTEITADITYTARWTAVTPDEPDEPDQPDEPDEPSDEPVISGQKAGGSAVDTGTISTTYGFRLIYNYWLARKTAIQEKKQLFILSGASWCSYCTLTKEYLQTLGDDFTDKFVVYYVDRDNLTASPYFKGGLPQYGSADPRKVNPFAGIYGDGTSGTPDWTKAWYASDNGLYYGNRGGFSKDEISRTLSEASDTIGDVERLEIRGPKSVMSGKANTYTLYAIFADGSEMLVDHGVTWSLMSGAGTMAVSTSDGDASTKLTVTSDQAVLRAESTYFFSGTVDLSIKSTQESKIKGLTIVTEALNLEDNRSPVLEATATLDDDTVVAISGVGAWKINSHTKKPRGDAELESSQAPNVTVDEFGQLTYDQGYQFDVYDHTLNVTLTANGVSVTKDITVWGPTKVAPVSWTLASKTPRLTRYGVVRLKCAKLKYNYGGEIKMTADTYYGNFRMAMQFAGGSSEYSYLRGLAFMSSKTTAGTWTMGLQAQRVNGQYQYWTPENFANYHSEQIENVAEGDTITDADHGLVTKGFFNAYWPTECSGKSETEFQAFALLDSDGDGFANWQEYILGTDPTDKSDALYLTQGYQHLTAPANDLEAFQYKIMFAQRPGRYYYIYAKENWGDEWMRVAKINYSGMAADQGLQITVLNETKANNGNFFRVGAVLADHEFNALSSAEVIPNMLVAAPNSVIDLTKETLPFNLISFDTDATHAGTVNVKVPESARTAGTVLISAPKSAKTSLEACKPYQSGDVEFEVVEDSSDASRMVLKVKGDEPVVYESPFMFTITENTTWSDIEWTDKNGHTAKWADLGVGSDAEVVLTASSPFVVTVDADVTVSAVTASENVTLRFENAWPTGFATALVKDAWQGTVLIADKTDCTGTAGCTFENLGNANSVVAFDNVSGWFNGFASNASNLKGKEYAYTLEIGAGGLAINNGSSNTAATFAKLTGTGALSVGKSGNPTMRLVALDASDYTGTLSVVGNAGIIIGTPTVNAANGEIRAEGTALASASYKIGGSGVVRLGQSDTAGKYNLSDVVGASAFADGFTGTLALGAGRYVYSADCVPSNVKISVEDGAQLFVGDGVTASNAVTIAGGGWGGETNYAVSKAALRLGNNAAISGALTVASDAKIGVHDGNTGTLNGVVSGSGTLTKWAGGTLLLSKATASNFTGRFIVGQGTVKANTGSANFFGCGSDATAIIVDKGATFDMNGKHSADLTICLNGGTLTNTDDDITSGKKTIRKIILTDDSTIAGSQSYGLIASNYAESFLDLQGHTLTFAMTAGKDFWMPNTTATNGTIVVQSGKFYPWHAGKGKSSRYYCTIRLEGGEFKVQGDSTVDTLVLAGGAITDTYALTIAKELVVEKTTTISRAITLGDAAKVNLPTNVTLTVNTAIGAAKFVLPDGYELNTVTTGSTYAYSAVATTPAIEDGKGTVEVTDEKIVVTPNENVTEIVISNPGERKVEIPPSVDRIGGLTDSSKVVIKHTFGDNKSVDLTKIMKFTQSGDGFAIALDENAKGKVVNVNGEEIPVQPELSKEGDAGAEKPFEVTDGGIALGVKTIPGLKYQVMKCATPGGKYEAVGSATTATGARLSLEIERGNDPSAFYKISVSK